MDTNNLATKTDIKDLKTDIKVVKLDIKDLKTDIKVVKLDIKDLKTDIKVVRGEILKVEERVENLEEGQGRIEAKLDKIANTLDGFVGRVDNLTDENEIGSHQIRELSLRVENHEKRLKHVELSKHTT